MDLIIPSLTAAQIASIKAQVNSGPTPPPPDQVVITGNRPVGVPAWHASVRIPNATMNYEKNFNACQAAEASGFYGMMYLSYSTYCRNRLAALGLMDLNASAQVSQVFRDNSHNSSTPSGYPWVNFWNFNKSAKQITMDWVPASGQGGGRVVVTVPYPDDTGTS